MQSRAFRGEGPAQAEALGVGTPEMPPLRTGGSQSHCVLFSCWFIRALYMLSVSALSIANMYHLPFTLLIMHFNKQYLAYFLWWPIFQPFLSWPFKTQGVGFFFFFFVPLSQVSALLCTFRKCLRLKLSLRLINYSWKENRHHSAFPYCMAPPIFSICSPLLLGARSSPVPPGRDLWPSPCRASQRLRDVVMGRCAGPGYFQLYVLT